MQLAAMVPPIKPYAIKAPVFKGAAAQAAWVNEGHGKSGSVSQLARGLKSACAHWKRNTANVKQARQV